MIERTCQLILAGTMTACVTSQHAIPPVLERAPERLVEVPICVSTEVAVPSYWERKGVGRVLATSLESETRDMLLRAGYRIVEPSSTCSGGLQAVASGTLAGSINNLDSRTTVSLSHEGRILASRTLNSPTKSGHLSLAQYPRHVAIHLANLLSTARQKPRIEIPRIADAVPVLAAFDIHDGGHYLDETARAQLSQYVAVRITEVLGYRLVPRAQLRTQLLSAKMDAQRACYDQACQIELGKALSAEKTLATKLIRVGDTCALTATLYDLKTETAEVATSIKTECRHNTLLQGVDNLVERLKDAQGT